MDHPYINNDERKKRNHNSYKNSNRCAPSGIATELTNGYPPYHDLPHYILTHKHLSDEFVRFYIGALIAVFMA